MGPRAKHNKIRIVANLISGKSEYCRTVLLLSQEVSRAKQDISAFYLEDFKKKYISNYSLRSVSGHKCRASVNPKL